MAQTFGWAKMGDVGTGYNTANNIATDPDGNVYVTGWFSNTTTFGTVSVTSSGGSDFFLAKYDSTGNLMWVRNGGSSGTEIGYGVKTDNFGNIYVTGTYGDSIRFGSTLLTTASAASGGNVFLAKFGSDGSVKWAKQATSTEAQGQAVAVDKLGRPYIAGYFKDHLNFGTTSLTTGSLNSAMFIAKYDSAGNVIWSENSSGSSVNAYGIAIDNNNKAVVTGYFVSSASFGTTSLSGSAGYDFYLVDYDTLGNVVWAKSGGSTANDQGNAVSIDFAGNIYVTGSVGSPASIDTVSITGSEGSFVAKFNTSGRCLWVRQITDTQPSVGGSIIADSSGSTYVTGYFKGAGTFGSLAPLTSAGGWDVFITKYNTSGSPVWRTAAGGNGDDFSYGIARYKGQLYIAGSFQDTAHFGGYSLESTGGTDIFSAKIMDTTYAAPPVSPSHLFFAERPIQISVYPNPANAYISLFGQGLTNSIVIITDVTGRELVKKFCDQDHVILDVNHLLPGMYFARICTKNGETLTEKITVMH